MAQHRSEKPLHQTYSGRRWLGTMGLLLALVLAVGGWQLLTHHDGLAGFAGLLILVASSLGALTVYEWMQR